MSLYYTNESELTNIANAIRTATGIAEELTYPDGYIEALSNISGANAAPGIVASIYGSWTGNSTSGASASNPVFKNKGTDTEFFIYHPINSSNYDTHLINGGFLCVRTGTYTINWFARGANDQNGNSVSLNFNIYKCTYTGGTGTNITLLSTIVNGNIGQLSSFNVALTEGEIIWASGVGSNSNIQVTLGFTIVPNAIDMNWSSELNFKIVGGTTQPTSPANNTIWINTNTTLNDWEIGYNEVGLSTTRSVGDIWLYNNPNCSTVEINMLKKNGILIHPTYAYLQTSSDTFELKELKIYQNNSWKTPCRYLYIDGNTENNSSWVGSAAYGTSAYSGGSVSYEIDYIDLKTASTGNAAGYSCGPSYTIDLTNFNYIKTEISYLYDGATAWNNKGSFGIVVSTTAANTTTNFHKNAVLTGYMLNYTNWSGYHSIDISSLTGSYYVGFHTKHASTNSSTMRVYIKKVWLE